MDKPDLSLFPAEPGVYLYKDDTGRIVYVGKARRLRQRIASYFRDESCLSPKTRTMLRAAASIDILRTGTEKEALLLEASLIKKMEELGIGRPSTYAATLTTLKDRDYVRLEGKALHPEDRGRIVTAFLESFFSRYVEYGFTAGLEEQHDHEQPCSPEQSLENPSILAGLARALPECDGGYRHHWHGLAHAAGGFRRQADRR